MMETTLSMTKNTALDTSQKAQTNSTINDRAESNMEKDIKSLTADLFPWVCEFQQKFKVIYRDFSMHKLTELMQYYTRNISVSARECYSRPSRAAYLKESISDTLTVFLNIYRMLSENHDRCIYLNYMSDLLAIYINIELKASKRTKEDQGKICARLISCLYVYLEHSTEHLLDTLLKVQFMYRCYHGILNPVIKKIIKNIPFHPESNIMYVRYLLVYRLWRKINSNTPIKNEITSIAVTSLGPPPTFPHLLDDVLPKVPKSQPNPAKLLLHDKFDTRRTCEVFVQFSKESNKSVYTEYREDVRDTMSSSSICDIEKDVNLTPKNVDNFDNNVNSNLSDNSTCNNFISSHHSDKSVTTANETRLKNFCKISDNISDNVSTNINVPKLFTKIKSFSRKKSKKSRKVILIDLTGDVELEKCLINKRRLKKPAWLEEAKRQIGLKSMKTSMKIKSRIQKKLDNTNSSKCETESDYQLQNTTLKTSKITSKDDAVDTFMCDVKNSGNTDSDNPNLIVSSLPKSLTSDKLSSSMIYTTNINNVNIDTTTTKSSSDNNELSLDASVEIVDDPTNTRKYNDNDVLVLKKDNIVNNRLKPAVIKRLIEKEISIENEICEKSDGKKKICDLKPQPSIIESISIDSQCNSKDEIDSLNLSKTVEKNSASENVVVYFKNKQDEHGDQNTLVNENVKSACIKEEQNLSTNSYFEKNSESRNTSAIELENSNTNKNIESEGCTILKLPINNAYDKKDILINNEILDQQQIFCESKNHSEISCPGYLNSTVSFSVMNGDDSDLQAEVEIDNCIEVDDYIDVDKMIDPAKNIYDMKENVINIAKNTVINDNEIKHTCKEDLVNNQYVNQSVEYDKLIYNDKDSAQKVIENLDRSKSPSYTVSPTIFQKDVQLLNHSHDSNLIKSKNKGIYEIEEINNDSKISDKEYILHCTELNTEENIDGLSLLASVSQHVPHLKDKSEIQCDQIKVKDYTVLKNTSSNQVINDETDTNDSSNTISQLYENPTSDLIKRIIGVYPEDGVYSKKVELCVNLISASNGNVTNTENTSSINNVPRIFQGSMNYETSDTISNVIVPLENNAQSTKENTNVIHNGETVVLLQKSPNSNLYIINKAVENAKNHNDNDMNKITEKFCVSPHSENGSSYEISSALDHNFIQEKYSIDEKKNIKVEPNEDNATLNLEEEELYMKKTSLRTNRISNLQATLQDIDVANVTTINESNDNKHKSSSKSVSVSACRQNIKQEFTTLPPNRIPTNYTVQGYAGMHSHSHEAIESQHSLHISASHPTTLPQSICSNCSAATDLCVPYRKHCKSASCSLQINTTASLHSHVNSNNTYGRSHCSCLNYTYDIVTHCRQCIHSGTDSHVSCIESNTCFLPTHSSVQASTVQEHDRTKNETVIGKLYDDNIVCKVEKDLLQNNTLETIDMKCDTSKLSNTNFYKKLPLKKRLKTMMSMHYKEKQIKTEKLDNYPGIPMMSIAALEPLDIIQKHQNQIVKPVLPLSPNRKDDIHGNYHFTTNLVRRDYCKDIHDTTTHESNITVCQESCHQRTFKTPAQRKEIAASEITAMKRFTSETMATDVRRKKAKEMQSPIKMRRRSSRRNVPKVNYSYTDNDSRSSKRKVPKVNYSYTDNDSRSSKRKVPKVEYSYTDNDPE